MRNILRFATRVEYLAAKGSEGVIYKYLIGDNADEVSVGCVSYIEETGETLADAVNVIVSESEGSIGDVLLDRGGVKFWLKSYKDYQATEYGGAYKDLTRLANAGYKTIGALVHKDGDEGLLCAIDNISGVWSTNTTILEGVTTISNIRRRNSQNNSEYYDSWVASGSQHRAEELYGARDNANGTPYCYQYTYPLPKRVWDMVVDAIKSNTALSGTLYTDSTEVGSYSVVPDTAIGIGNITYKCTEGNVTINPKDYNYNYTDWYRAKILAQFPTRKGCLTDMDGLTNTKYMLTDSTSTIAANANNYDVDVDGYRAGSWYLPAAGEMMFVMHHYALLKSKGYPITSTWYWVSTQYSSQGAWYVTFYDATVSHNAKSGSGVARAFHKLNIKY